jgi:predicted dehydrogenase
VAGSIRLGVLSVQRIGANRGSPGWRPAWRTDRALAGGGILVDHGTHLFYQMHTLFGPPVSIACRTERRLPDYGVDDTATVYLRYERRLVRLHLTWAAFERRTTHRYVGDRGEIICLDDEVRVCGDGGVRTLAFETGLSHGSAHSDWFAPLLVQFAERVARRDYRTDRLDEAITTAAYITRAYASAAREGAVVTWEEPLPAPLMDAFVAAG